MDAKAKFNMEDVNGERTGSAVGRIHGPFREGQQTVLPLAQLNAHSRVDPSILKKIDEFGIADNTTVVGNGSETFSSWPDGGNYPFRGAGGAVVVGRPVVHLVVVASRRAVCCSPQGVLIPEHPTSRVAND
jgi:hypothetical protein